MTFSEFFFCFIYVYKKDLTFYRVIFYLVIFYEDFIGLFKFIPDILSTII